MASRQFARNAAAMVALVAVIALVALASLASVAAPYDPVAISLGDKLRAPSASHWLGTDYFGRDVLSRVIWGGRVSLVVGLLVAAIAMAVGVPIALVAGFAGGRVDNILMRVMDAFLTFPPLLLTVAIVGSLGADIWNVMLALGLVNIPVFARLVRGSTLAVREELYVAAARALGATAPRIVVAHVLPNVVAPIVVQVTVTFSAAIIAEASLSFLGLGAQPPHPSWGRDLNEARRYLVDAPWLLIGPTLAITTSVLSLNFLGDGLRDAMDPRSWRR
ncbi:MAG TPA: ABC transporter permease [Methylomirabilota bacterium]|nr:ABC transporter permease [Methylomirabilota bacterium]